MNLVCRTSKVKEKTDQGAWGLGEGHKPSLETWEDCLAVSPRSKRSGKRPTLEGGGALGYLLVKGLDRGLHI